ncbi:peptidoglycan DD-metalloendopeptidase family protein [Virgibacillus sediminis]|uniref:Peptidoglycan DD-metalloendopeptidase family protein n=1 Tax=Virgibacillus sediminis TaxID=202260 RepID=A0ABV7A7L3_9BACI
MKEENTGASKNKWSRIFRKKWFFPALYLTIAALLLSVVVWYQNLDNQVPDAAEDQEEIVNDGDFAPTPMDEEANPVVDQQESIKMPVADEDQAEIVTKFYDYNADQEDQENALVLYNNRFYQSTGVDIASADGEAFSVQAALSGTVNEVKEDPLLGNVVILSHGNEIMTYYASLEDVTVQAGEEVKQGDELGTSGQNLFGKENGTHVHFQLRKDGNEVNPEEFFNQPVTKLDSVTEEASEGSESQEDAEASEESEAAEDAEEPAAEGEEEAAEDTDEDVKDDETEEDKDAAEDDAEDELDSPLLEQP